MAILEKDITVVPTRLAGDLAAIIEELRRSTVQVRASRARFGSGVIWRADGLIITNAHVVRGPRAQIELRDGRVLEARLIKQNPARDLAALQAAAQNLPAATAGDSDALRVGEVVLAVGNPLGLTGAATMGIVHRLGAFPPERAYTRGGPVGQPWVQADVRLAPGNSGGPLANAIGQVIGINSMVVGGLALAVPSNAVERFLREDSPPRLGVTMQPALVPWQGQRTFGWRVLEVESGGPAAEAGLRAGDALIGAHGQFFHDAEDFFNTMERLAPDAVLTLDVVRRGQRLSRDVVFRPVRH